MAGVILAVAVYSVVRARSPDPKLQEVEARALQWVAAAERPVEQARVEAARAWGTLRLVKESAFRLERVTAS